MLRVVDCIVAEHDVRLVLVAAAVCLFGCFAAVSLLTRARRPEGVVRLYWLSAAAFVGGGGIWSTHFVAMLAYESLVPVTYDIPMTLLSVVIAIGATLAGFSLALGGRTVLGGTVAGAAVAAMHFTGMFAIRGPVQAHWSAEYVVASVVIGVAFGIAALKVALGNDTPFRRRIGAAALYACGIAGLHFTAMTAVSFALDPTIEASPQAVDPGILAVLVVAATMLIIGIGLTGSIVDQHLADRSVRESLRLRAHVQELEETQRHLENAKQTLSHALDEAAASSQAKSRFMAR